MWLASHKYLKLFEVLNLKVHVVVLDIQHND